MVIHAPQEEEVETLDEMSHKLGDPGKKNADLIRTQPIISLHFIVSLLLLSSSSKMACVCFMQTCCPNEVEI